MKRLLLALLLLLGIAYSVAWWYGRPAAYQLTISNSSESVVDSVAFVGNDIYAEKKIVQLQPGESQYLETEVDRQAELRIEILQSGNRIDTLIKKTAEPLGESQQTLTIYSGNRYIFSSSIEKR